MAVTYDFGKMRNHSAGYSSSNRATSATHRQPWNCVVHDPANPSFDPRTISPEQVMEQGVTQGDLPATGLSVWTDGIDVDVFSICTGKTCTRDGRNAGYFTGEASYQSPAFVGVSELTLAPRTIAASVDNYYAIYELAFTEHQEVLYEDFDTPPKPCRLPTGTYFTQPFFEHIAGQSYLITQLEDLVGVDDIEDRVWRVNSTAWTNAPGGQGTIGHWLIENVQVQRARVPISGNALHETFICQYRVKYNPIRPWWDRRALFDHYYNTTPNDPTTRTAKLDDPPRSIIEIMLETDGTERTGQTTPAYLTFKHLRETDFNSFFRPNSNPLP
jgi:hypothetical protein